MRWPSATACFTTTSLLSTKVSVVSNAAEDTNGDTECSTYLRSNISIPFRPFTAFHILFTIDASRRQLAAAPDIISFLQRKKETPEIKKLSLESTIEILIHAPFSEGFICFSDFNVCGATVD